MDNDLISRSALLEELKVQRGIERIKGVATINMAIDKGIEIAIRSIVSAPAVDAVPVVRCTECQYMKIKAGLCYCKVWQGYNGMGSEGFCSYGERRTE